MRAEEAEILGQTRGQWVITLKLGEQGWNWSRSLAGRDLESSFIYRLQGEVIKLKTI